MFYVLHRFTLYVSILEVPERTDVATCPLHGYANFKRRDCTTSYFCKISVRIAFISTCVLFGRLYSREGVNSGKLFTLCTLLSPNSHQLLPLTLFPVDAFSHVAGTTASTLSLPDPLFLLTCDSELSLCILSISVGLLLLVLIG